MSKLLIRQSGGVEWLQQGTYLLGWWLDYWRLTECVSCVLGCFVSIGWIISSMPSHFGCPGRSSPWGSFTVVDRGLLFPFPRARDWSLGVRSWRYMTRSKISAGESSCWCHGDGGGRVKLVCNSFYFHLNPRSRNKTSFQILITMESVGSIFLSTCVGIL